ncbi:hypothetical protein [Dongia sp.]|uniref:hypothetical protein n=1 Tax=Dongia sp. TaxID=1977262 RepID=UPI003753D846
MAKKNKAAKKKAGVKPQAVTPLRATSGAGFDFEDQISAWLMVKMLFGETIPGIGGTGIMLQAQVGALGWLIDDLLVTTSHGRHLAISAKGNTQVTSAGLPSDFVSRAWKMWRDPNGIMDRSRDSFALVTQGSRPDFDAPWAEVTKACSGSDSILSMRRIREAAKQSKVFHSVQKPNDDQPGAPDDETIALIRHLHVLPMDLQSSYSDTKNQVIGQCRQLLISRDATEGEELWDALIAMAKEVRLSSGTLTIEELWSALRTKFRLRDHPDYAPDWEILRGVTYDHKRRIKTQLSSGHQIARPTEVATLKQAIANNIFTVVFGESGSGKSALVKTVLDGEFADFEQVWFGPDELKIALSAGRRSSLGLRHDLTLVLNAASRPKNILVIDSVERIDPSELAVIDQLIQSICPALAEVADATWHIVFVTQPQNWADWADTLLIGRNLAPFGVEALTKGDVRAALQASPAMSWLTAHDETVAVLTNLRTLAWVVDAGPAFARSAGLASHTAIADRLWRFWTGDRTEVEVFVMKLAEREASFERSFPLTSIEVSELKVFDGRPAALPLRLNDRTKSIEFEHDLAADWARYQYLKSFAADTRRWAALAGNPLWTNALRMLGQFLLRETEDQEAGWDVGFKAAEAERLTSASDLLLDALCLDPDAERFMGERVDLLMANEGFYLNRLLNRFHHLATVPKGGASAIQSDLALYMETKFRTVVIGQWFPLLGFVVTHRERLSGLVLPSLSKALQAWLTGTPRFFSDGTPVRFRREAAELALEMARTIQVEKWSGTIYAVQDFSPYTAALAAAVELPEEVSQWALELCGRRDLSTHVLDRVQSILRLREEKHQQRLRDDPIYRLNNARRENLPTFLSSSEELPPWPIGAQFKTDRDLRTAVFKENGLVPLMVVRPAAAAEILLALIVEDEPERDSSRYEIELGLEYAQDSYPTAYWKSPLFSFLQVSPDTALGTVIDLVNFCTDRWKEQVVKDRDGEAPRISLTSSDGTQRQYFGRRDVFDWTQHNDMRIGSLSSALDSVERWLTLQVSAGIDLTPHLHRLLHECPSAAVIGLLINVGKYRPELFLSPLKSLLTNFDCFDWDQYRVRDLSWNMSAWTMPPPNEFVFALAKSWVLAPHRQKVLLSVISDLLNADDAFAADVKAAVAQWVKPENRKELIEFELISAALDRDNHHRQVDPETGREKMAFVVPEWLQKKVSDWDAEHQASRQQLLMPEQLEQVLAGQKAITLDSSEKVFSLLQEAETTNDEGGEAGWNDTYRFALAATLVVNGESWLLKNPEAEKEILDIIRGGLSAIPSSAEEMRSRRIGPGDEKLKFLTYAAMHRWRKGGAEASEWEEAILMLMTSGSGAASSLVFAIGHAYRQSLGASWWRLLHLGVLWSALILLTPHFGDDEQSEVLWSKWLASFRKLKIAGVNAPVDEFRFQRVATLTEKLLFARRERSYEKEELRFRGRRPKPRAPLLDSHVLGNVFGWLLVGGSPGEWSEETRIALELWQFDIARAEAERRESGEYDIPGQQFGYGVLTKLADLTLSAPAGAARPLWESVLRHGPNAHYAIQQYILGIFEALGRGSSIVPFEVVWREMIEYALARDWGSGDHWSYGERMLCSLLGYGNERILAQSAPGAVSKFRDLYERWAEGHLGHDDDCFVRFNRFLTADAGAPLRLAGLCWISSRLKQSERPTRWWRNGLPDSLVELLDTTINKDRRALAGDPPARQAVLDIAAIMVSANIPSALPLQERIKQLLR